MSSHARSTAGEEMRAFRKSVGTLCTAPVEIFFLTITPFYQISPDIYFRIKKAPVSVYADRGFAMVTINHGLLVHLVFVARCVRCVAKQFFQTAAFDDGTENPE